MLTNFTWIRIQKPKNILPSEMLIVFRLLDNFFTLFITLQFFSCLFFCFVFTLNCSVMKAVLLHFYLAFFYCCFYIFHICYKYTEQDCGKRSYSIFIMINISTGEIVNLIEISLYIFYIELVKFCRKQRLLQEAKPSIDLKILASNYSF